MNGRRRLVAVKGYPTREGLELSELVSERRGERKENIVCDDETAICTASIAVLSH